MILRVYSDSSIFKSIYEWKNSLKTWSLLSSKEWIAIFDKFLKSIKLLFKFGVIALSAILLITIDGIWIGYLKLIYKAVYVSPKPFMFYVPIKLKVVYYCY